MTATDFTRDMLQFSNKVSAIKANCKTEESTKHSLILPVIQMLGYDIFDPTEVVPEVDCDIRRNGDKVDYVIQHDGEQIILIECKHWMKDLDNYVDQLSGYFVASKARFGILTNGIEYRFYADLKKANLMDKEPFLVVDIERLTEDSLEGLNMFRRDTYNEQYTIGWGENRVLMNTIRKVVDEELTSPSFDLITFFARRIYGQVPSKSVRERMTPLVTNAIHDYSGRTGVEQNKQTDIETNDPGILDTVQSILSGTVAADRVQTFHGTSYSSIRLDGSQWFPIIKYRYSGNAQWIAVGKYCPKTMHFYCNQREDKLSILAPSDIHKYAKDIRDIVTVMLMGDGHDDERVRWVTEFRPDWCI